MKYAISISLLLIAFGLQAADFSTLDVRSTSLGHVYAVSKEFVNPSSLSFQPRPVIGLTVNNRYQIKELNTFSLDGMFPNPFLDAGLKIMEFGYADYHLWTIKGGISKKITSRIAFGTNICYQKVVQSVDEGIKPFISADMGAYFQLNEKFDFALLAENLVDNKTLDHQMVHLGMDYHVVPSCNLLLEFFSDCKTLSGISSGIEYELMDHFYLRMGLYTRPLTPTFGMAFSFDSFTVDVGCDKHQVLGYSTLLGLSCHF